MEFQTMRTKYYNMLEEAAKNKSQKVLMRKKWVDMMILRVESAKAILLAEGPSKLPKAAEEALEKYDVINPNLKKMLVFKIGGSSQKVIVPLEESYQIVQRAHLYTFHGSSANMDVWLANSNYFVSSICTPVLYRICDKCLLGIPNDADLELNLHDIYKTIALVLMIDMTLQPDKSFKYLLVYQDLNTKFLQLRPMVGNDIVNEILVELTKLFCDFSPPECLVVPNEYKQMFKPVINQLNNVFNPNIKLEINKVDSSSVIADIEVNITEWMKQHTCSNWAIGCHIVQWQINNKRASVHTAFEKFFGLNRGCGENNQDIETTSPQSITESQNNVESDVPNKPTKIEHNASEPMVENVTKVKPNVEEPQFSPEKPESIMVKTEPEEESPIKEIHVCCTCNGTVTTQVYFCCVCNKSLHQYCGARRQTDNDVVQSVCFLCLS